MCGPSGLLDSVLRTLRALRQMMMIASYTYVCTMHVKNGDKQTNRWKSEFYEYDKMQKNQNISNVGGNKFVTNRTCPLKYFDREGMGGFDPFIPSFDFLNIARIANAVQCHS